MEYAFLQHGSLFAVCMRCAKPTGHRNQYCKSCVMYAVVNAVRTAIDALFVLNKRFTVKAMTGKVGTCEDTAVLIALQSRIARETSLISRLYCFAAAYDPDADFVYFLDPGVLDL